MTTQKPPRSPEDDAAEATLIDHEAERLDAAQAAREAAEARFRAVASAAVRLLTPKSPSAERIRKAQALIVKGMLVEMGEGGNGLREMVKRQQRERRAVFAKRSTKRLRTMPITKAAIAARKAAIEAAREGKAG